MGATAATRGPQISVFVVADSPDSWRSGGFNVDANGICMLGPVAISCTGGEGGFQSWDFDGISPGVSEIDGLTVAGPRGAGQPAVHPNGISAIDHIVIRTGSCKRTTIALESAGFPRRGGRSANSYGTPMAQSFFWAGDVILELVGPDVGEPTTDEPTSIFGLALVAPNLEATAQFLGELLGKPKPAVQEGRMIAGFRNRSVGISLPIAVMSPHPSDP